MLLPPEKMHFMIHKPVCPTGTPEYFRVSEKAASPSPVFAGLGGGYFA
jgi:hypothetical protein